MGTRNSRRRPYETEARSIAPEWRGRVKVAQDFQEILERPVQPWPTRLTTVFVEFGQAHPQSGTVGIASRNGFASVLHWQMGRMPGGLAQWPTPKAAKEHST